MLCFLFLLTLSISKTTPAKAFTLPVEKKEWHKVIIRQKVNVLPRLLMTRKKAVHYSPLKGLPFDIIPSNTKNITPKLIKDVERIILPCDNGRNFMQLVTKKVSPIKNCVPAS